MKTYTRIVEGMLNKLLHFKPVIILYGARQIGKTTVVKNFAKKFTNPLFISCDIDSEKKLLENKSVQELLLLINSHDLVIIDEAQMLSNVGITLKIIADNIDKTKVQIIATGSSSFELRNKLNEPLTGRNTKLTMFPLSVKELVDNFSYKDVSTNINTYLTYGTYPGVIEQDSFQLKKKALEDITNDYLYKDLFILGDIRNRVAFKKVVEQLAVRTGREINYDDISKYVGVSADTVRHYVDLLEESFVVFRVRPFYTNKLTEISKSQRVYFVDIGIRNAILGDYKDMDSRSDKGFVFENFVVSEMYKKNIYNDKNSTLNFWRKQSGATEIDVVETDGLSKILHTYEIKWKDNSKLPIAFANEYGEQKFMTINNENLVQFLNQS